MSITKTRPLGRLITISAPRPQHHRLISIIRPAQAKAKPILNPPVQRRHLTMPLATAASLDHLVLTVASLDKTIRFYERYLGMEHTSFRSKDTERHALTFGTQKINLHVSGREFEPKAENVQPGSGDLCFLIHDDVDEVCTRLKDDGVEVLEGGGVVDRTGAQGKIRSVYVRDPDGNLIELSNLVEKS